MYDIHAATNPIGDGSDYIFMATHSRGFRIIKITYDDDDVPDSYSSSAYSNTAGYSYGLAFDSGYDYAYVADGTNGLVVYDIDNGGTIQAIPLDSADTA